MVLYALTSAINVNKELHGLASLPQLKEPWCQVATGAMTGLLLQSVVGLFMRESLSDERVAPLFKIPVCPLLVNSIYSGQNQ